MVKFEPRRFFDLIALAISKIVHFLTFDIWRIQQRDFSRVKWFLIRQLRFLMVAVRGLAEDKIQLRASALTFNTLLAIVPLAAVVFGVAKGFGFEKALEQYIIENLQMHVAVITRVIEFSRSLLENAKGGVIAGIGFVVLFWAIIRVLANIERSFNDIWGIERSRSIMRKISDYLSFMLICPFLLVMSSTMTVIVSSQVRLIISKVALLDVLSPAITLGLKFIPLFMMWILFTFIYIFMPNTRVKLQFAAVAGLIAAVLFQVFQVAYINSQIFIAKYNAVYGSFAALPLFLIWLQTSWLIVLLGAELSFAGQNVEMYKFEQQYQKVSYSFKKLLSLRIAHLLVKNFSRAQNPWNEAQIARALEIPIRLAREILRDLHTAGVISRVTLDDERMVAYQPARNPKDITVQYVIDALETQGVDDIPVAESKELKKLAVYLKTFHNLIAQSSANIRLQDI
ncbi:MAG: YihY family inner membrane protein [Deltaproteobacteria bacterium]|nr:YihY family inner membrane protein [Deltaproteobacteria bacterium]